MGCGASKSDAPGGRTAPADYTPTAPQPAEPQQPQETAAEPPAAIPSPPVEPQPAAAIEPAPAEPADPAPAAHADPAPAAHADPAPAAYVEPAPAAYVEPAPAEPVEPAEASAIETVSLGPDDADDLPPLPPPISDFKPASLDNLPRLSADGQLPHFEMPADVVKQMSAEIDAELESIMESGEVAEARAMFDAFDKDASGSLEIRELQQLLKSLKFELTGQQFSQYLNMLFKHLDKDRDGSLTWDEFEKFYHRFLASEKVRAKFSRKAVEKMNSLEQKQKARDAFAAADKDGSGALDHSELSDLLRLMLVDVHAQMGAEAWSGFVHDVIARGDKDANAVFDCDEFLNYYEKCLAAPEVVQKYEQKVLLRYQESSGELVMLDFEA